jgi:calcium-translocating P-type ATPase
MRAIGPLSIAYAIVTGVLTRSLPRALTAALLVNPRPAMAGREAADRGAATRVLRAGATVPGSRPDRPVRRPDVLVVEAARVVTDGWELGPIAALADGMDDAEALRIATAISVATDSPWGAPFPPTARVSAGEARFDGRIATARVDGRDWMLGPHASVAFSAVPSLPADAFVLALRLAANPAPAALIALMPKAAPGLSELRSTCERHGVGIELLAARETPLARALAERLQLELVAPASAVARVRALQGEGLVVAVLADGVRAGEAFEICDLAIGLTSGRSGRFLARADLLAPRLDAVVEVIEAGIRRDAALRDGVALSIAANIGGIAWGLRSSPPFSRGSVPSQLGGLVAMADAALRMAGGRRSLSVAERLSDPLPERWGRRDVTSVLRHFETRPGGLTAQEAATRERAPDPDANGTNPFLVGMLDQIRSPLVAVLGVGAAVSLAAGAMGDVLMIGAVVVANAVVGAVQERQGGQAIEALRARGSRTARVRRDGREQVIAATELVPGDVLVLAAGQRIAADARVIEAMALEVDEAPLTGESLPIEKFPDRGAEAERIVLEGSDVRAGSGLAVVVAVGAATRMGALAAAISETPRTESALDRRLSRLLTQTLPLVALGGAVVAASGVLWGNALGPQLALGASVAIAAVPEGLPLLAGVAEAAVARRLAGRNALVARLSAVEALGRIDVACADKTGTLTEGRLAVTAVCDVDGVTAAPGGLRPSLREILVAAALASPPPDSTAASAHATDAAVIAAAAAEGIQHHVQARREDESPFDAARGYHSTLAEGRLNVKGAVEELVSRCSGVRRGGRVEPLDAAGRHALLARANGLAGQGLRVLMIAEGGARTSAANPRELTALGFVAISDPLRPSVPAAIARCAAAGVRTIMITGDHPATAISIARAAGLPAARENVMTGPEIGQLDDDALGARLETTYVLARSTPLDKLRIVEALQSRGHVVAMTGDGVNDAPSLRLADVGVAMGSGTEVARQAADLVVMDNDFATLAEALVEGRAFWQNMRRALGLLLGGNAGEVGLVTAATVAGLGPALTTRQVLAINLVTDVLPAVAIAVQPPEHRDLAALAREGSAALDAPLRDDIVRRALATAIASFGAYAVAAKVLPPEPARTVGFTSIVTTQLAQTLDLGRAEGKLTGSVAGAVGLSLAFVLAASTVPPLRTFLGLGSLTPAGAGLAAAASIGAVALSRWRPADTTARKSYG